MYVGTRFVFLGMILICQFSGVSFTWTIIQYCVTIMQFSGIILCNLQYTCFRNVLQRVIDQRRLLIHRWNKRFSDHMFDVIMISQGPLFFVTQFYPACHGLHLISDRQAGNVTLPFKAWLWTVLWQINGDYCIFSSLPFFVNKLDDEGKKTLFKLKSMFNSMHLFDNGSCHNCPFSGSCRRQ